MTQPLDRRVFLSHASATALAVGAGAVFLPGRTPHLKADDVNDLATMPIIDTHQHLWDLSKFNIPWTKNEGVEVLNRDYLTADYLKATEGLNVVKAVYMEVDVHPDHQVKEAEHIKRLCASDDNPTVAAVISGRPSPAGLTRCTNPGRVVPGAAVRQKRATAGRHESQLRPVHAQWRGD